MAQNIRKVAVVMKLKGTQFIELDQARPLAAVIKDIATEWSLTHPNEYALKFNEDKKTFITERNRHEIKNGDVLKLDFSPSKAAHSLVELMKSGAPKERKEALGDLILLANDITFAQEFINKKGLLQLIHMIENGVRPAADLSFSLKAFSVLMEHGIVSWDVVDNNFIKAVSGLITDIKVAPDIFALQCSLEILENYVLNSTAKFTFDDFEVTPAALIHHLQRKSQMKGELPDQEIQKNAIALINALFLKADPSQKKRIADGLQTKSIRNIILNNVIQRRPSSEMDGDMHHQLYILQCLLFSQVAERAKTKVDSNDQVAIKEVMDLRRIAFDSDPDPTPQPGRRQSNVKDYKKLGFKHHVNPVEDFNVVPPGALSLDNMVYFAKVYSENYTKVVLENCCQADERDCPFAQASIELTKMLCDILKVGEQPDEEQDVFYPMFFTHDHPFEEFYCLCIQLLNKTWKEMRATVEDFPKVLNVVREQIIRDLENRPATFEEFRHQQLNYGEILNIWQQERRHKEEWESQARPIQELREHITPEIMELIKQQRLNHLVEGTRFHKYNKGARVKSKFQFTCLSPNHKFIHYGDIEQDVRPTIDQLSAKIQVGKIEALLTGKDCPHVKASKKTNLGNTAFSLQQESEGREAREAREVINFVAPSENEFQIWTDGINALLGNPMNSSLTASDLDMLLKMEIKLRLLDTEGFSIPEHPPPIPKEPSNYDFAYVLDKP